MSDHEARVKDIGATRGHAVDYPLIGDAELRVAKLYDMIHPNASGPKPTAADNASVRSVFIIRPDRKAKAMLVGPMTSGRNFDEVLRLLDLPQLTATHTLVTPVNWRPGEDVIIPPSVSDDEARKKHPGGSRRLRRICASCPSRNNETGTTGDRGVEGQSNGKIARDFSLSRAHDLTRS